MYKRFIEDSILSSLTFSPSILVLGGRQSGKTTLVNLIKEHYNPEYLTFDDLQLLRSAKAYPERFFKTNPPPVILDEVQRVPDLFLPMKKAIDEDRRNGMFLLTGSANPLMLPDLGDSLTGRMIIHHLWPLSQGELIGKKERFLDAIFEEEFPKVELHPLDSDDLFKKILVGGFPTMQTLKGDLERGAWCNGYLQTILDKDVRDLAQIEKLGELPHLLELLATRPGSLLNYANLSAACQIPRTTLIRYLEYMKTLFMIHLLPPWLANHGKRLTKSPKVYFNDTGILSHLLRLTEADQKISGALLGHIIENFIVVELQKQLSWNQPNFRLYFYRDHVGNEIDMIIEGPRKEVVAIEIKANETIKPDFFKVMEKFRKSLGPRFKRGIVLYSGDKVLSFGENMLALPLQTIWSTFR